MRSGVNWIREKDRSRHAFEEHVAAREQSGQHVTDHIVVADDNLAHFFAKSPEVVDELLDPLLLRLRRGRRRHTQLLSPRDETAAE